MHPCPGAVGPNVGQEASFRNQFFILNVAVNVVSNERGACDAQDGEQTNGGAHTEMGKLGGKHAIDVRNVRGQG
jgi:hypothetical protein